MLAGAAERVAAKLAVLEQRLATSAFVASDSFTLADIGLGGVVARLRVSMARAAELYRTDFSKVAALPNVDRWFESLSRRESFVNGCLTPERLHASLEATAPLPSWYVRYNDRIKAA